jgi:hypothetical protein
LILIELLLKILFDENESCDIIMQARNEKKKFQSFREYEEYLDVKKIKLESSLIKDAFEKTTFE